MMLEEKGFGLYELGQYVQASFEHKMLIVERENMIREIYEDISPTITSMDYDTGLLYTKSSHTESTALMIIDKKAKYDALIKKWELKANMFDQAMDTLNPREQDVIRVQYFRKKNDLGLSDEYFRDTLQTAQIKLCAFLEQTKDKNLVVLKQREKQALIERIHAS